MPELKNNFSGAKMNKDLDERIVPNGQYRDAMNIQISTSDADSSGVGNVGVVQNLQGNELVTQTSVTKDYAGNASKIIASIADESKNKTYYFTAAPVPIDGILSISNQIDGERIWVDSITEVSAEGPVDISKFIFVDKFAVTNLVKDIFSLENIPNGILQYDTLEVLTGTGSKYRVGMRIYAYQENTFNSLWSNSEGDPWVEIVKIQGDTLFLSDIVQANLLDASSLIFIHPKRALEFDYYNGDTYGTINVIPSSSINILENLLMWSDGKHEPKKINIDRCEAGTNINGVANDGQTHTKLFVKDPGNSQLVQIDSLEYLDTEYISTDILQEHVTTIKKAPLYPPNITMRVNDRDPALEQFPIGGFTIVQDTDGDGDIDAIDVPLSAEDQLQVTFPGNVDFREDDIYTFEAPGVLSNPLKFRAIIVEIDENNPLLVTLELLFVDDRIVGSNFNDSLNPENWIATLEVKSPFFETKFGRFGYRYKYEDNECSTFSPWSELAFLPGKFEYTPIKGFNEGMANTVRHLVVRNFIPPIIQRPLDVKAIDILWKTTDDQNVYVVKTITRNIDDEWKDMVSNNTNLEQTGELIITSEMIYKVLESNQLLRAWDNVPRYAKAQGITSNRLVYGNYTQGYDIISKVGVEQSLVTKLVNFPFPKKSVKSLREYQFGIVIGDYYGRETPVISTGYKKELQDGNFEIVPNTTRIEKNLAKNSNKFKLKQKWVGSNPSSMPWMSYVKYYVKETSGEYYNLVLDRWYDGGENHIWLSFNSADRNKLDEETYLILKNEHGSQTPVEQEARYKILAIENEAPEYVRATNHDFPLVEMTPKHVYGGLNASQDYIGDNINGGVAANAIPHNIVSESYSSGETGAQSGIDRILSDNFDPSDYTFQGTPKVRIVGKYTDSTGFQFEAKSPFRVITQVIDNSSGEKGVGIRDPFSQSEVHMYDKISVLGANGLGTEADAVQNNRPTYFMEIRDQVMENKPEFAGKFFVKIARDFDIEESLLSNYLGGYEQIAAFNVAYISASQTNPADDNNDFATSMDFENASWETLGPFISDSSVDGGTQVGDCFIEDKIDPYPAQNSGGGSTASIERWTFGTENPSTESVARTSSFWTSWYNNSSRTAEIFIDEAPTSRGYFHKSSNDPGQWENENILLMGTQEIFTKQEGGEDPNGTVDQFFPPGLSDGGLTDGTKGQFAFSVIGENVVGGNASLFAQLGSASFFADVMTQDGTLFRFSNDPNQEIYRVDGSDVSYMNGNTLETIVQPYTFNSKNYEQNDDNSLPENYRDRTTILVRFRKLDNNNQVTNSGIDTSVWDPRGTIRHNGLGSFQIEIVKRSIIQTTLEESVVTAAACFETEPKETVGLDIYYEASPALPITLDNFNITSYVGANTEQLKASKFSVGNRQVQYQASNVNVNIPGQSFVSRTFGNDSIEVKTSEGTGTNNNLTTVISTTSQGVEESDGTCAALKDFVSFTDTNGLVTKSQITDHMKISTFGNQQLVEQSDRINSDVIIASNVNNIGVMIVTDNSNTQNIQAGMEVIGEDNTNISNGTFVQSVQPAGASLQIILSQPLVAQGVNINATFIDVTGIFKIKTAVWQFPVELPWFNCYSFGNGVESDRIRDDFNTPQIDNGIKVSSTFLEYGQETKSSSMIYSGIYNSTSSVNNLSEFNMAEKITKDLNTTYGSLQAIIARDNDVVAFTEDKVLRVQSGGKDALFNADGNAQLTASNRVLGTAMPFAGDYGISNNPESLAVDAYRMYFTDKQRGAVLRLSRDGITPISDIGMKAYFREKLKYYTNITGSFDGINDEYNLVLHSTPQYQLESNTSFNISFNEKSKGWISFKSFTPISAISVSDRYYSVNNNKIYKHYSSNVERNSFYDSTMDSVSNPSTASTIDVLFNQAPSIVKSFKTVNYEGTQSKIDEFATVTQDGINYQDGEFYNLTAKKGWSVENIETDLQKGFVPEFIEKEGKWYNYIRGENSTIDAEIDTSEFSIQGIGFLLNNSAVDENQNLTVSEFETIAAQGTGSITIDEIQGSVEGSDEEGEDIP